MTKASGKLGVVAGFGFARMVWSLMADGETVEPWLLASCM